jgi:hypothetical protein
MTATFSNINSSRVDLTLTGSMATGEYVDGIYFNFSPESSIPSLAISQFGPGPANSGINQSANAYQADGDGLYDIRIDFPNAGAGRFISNNVATFHFDLAGIDESFFNVLSAPHGGAGPFLSAIHVAGIADGATTRSVWMAPVLVPLPTAAWASMSSLAGLMGFGYIRRRRFSRS